MESWGSKIMSRFLIVLLIRIKGVAKETIEYRKCSVSEDTATRGSYLRDKEKGPLTSDCDIVGNTLYVPPQFWTKIWHIWKNYLKIILIQNNRNLLEMRINGVTLCDVN